MKTSRQSENGRQRGHSPSARPSVDLEIEELVLHGFAPSERHRIAAAMQHELSRLVREEGLPRSAENHVALTRLGAGAIHVRAGATARTTGAAIGAAVYRSLQQQGRVAAATKLGRPAPGVRNG